MAEMAIVSFLRISKPPYLQYRRPTDEAQSLEHLPLGEDCADPVFFELCYIFASMVAHSPRIYERSFFQVLAEHERSAHSAMKAILLHY